MISATIWERTDLAVLRRRIDAGEVPRQHRFPISAQDAGKSIASLRAEHRELIREAHAGEGAVDLWEAPIVDLTLEYVALPHRKEEADQDGPSV